MGTSRRLLTLHHETFAREGYRALVSLEPGPPLNAWTGEVLHLPIRDMTPPTLDQVLQACQFIEKNEKEGRGVVVHCFEGFGRTGTVLAGYLIWADRLPAAKAIEIVRQSAREAQYGPGRPVETLGQERLLESWACYVRGSPSG